MILTRQDLSDEENVKDCVHELREIMDHVLDQQDDMSVASYTSEWMKKWGQALIERLRDAGDEESDRVSELKADIEDLKASHKSKLNEIADEAVSLESAVRDLQKVIEQ